MTDLCLIYSIFPGHESARTMAQSLLREKLATCCNILSGMESHYVWEGKNEIANEVVMLCKTTTTTAPAATAHIAANHPYDTPAILQLPITSANDAFAAWVSDSVSRP